MRRNGGLENVDGIPAPAFTAHFPPSGALPETTGGRAELFAWAAAVRSAYSDFQLSVHVGPILGVHLTAARWLLSGTARSDGLSGQPGRVVRSSGVGASDGPDVQRCRIR